MTGQTINVCDSSPSRTVVECSLLKVWAVKKKTKKCQKVFHVRFFLFGFWQRPQANFFFVLLLLIPNSLPHPVHCSLYALQQYLGRRRRKSILTQNGPFAVPKRSPHCPPFLRRQEDTVQQKRSDVLSPEQIAAFQLNSWYTHQSINCINSSASFLRTYWPTQTLHRLWFIVLPGMVWLASSSKEAPSRIDSKHLPQKETHSTGWLTFVHSMDGHIRK